ATRPRDAVADRAVAGASPGPAAAAARDHGGPAVSARQFQRQLRSTDRGGADGRTRSADRAVARLPLGHGAAAGRDDHDGGVAAADRDHVPGRYSDDD